MKTHCRAWSPSTGPGWCSLRWDTRPWRPPRRRGTFRRPPCGFAPRSASATSAGSSGRSWSLRSCWFIRRRRIFYSPRYNGIQSDRIARRIGMIALFRLLNFKQTIWTSSPKLNERNRSTQVIQSFSIVFHGSLLLKKTFGVRKFF